jgi:F-type H+-transporting ATPase subunit b
MLFFPLPLLASEGGFGLNLNLFETNVINLAIVIAGLVYFLRGFLGGILDRRRTAIVNDLREAEERLSTATASLSQAQKALAEAQQKAEQIRADGRARADALRLELSQRTAEEVARLKQEAMSDLRNEAARVGEELRREAARQAVEKALATLPGRLDARAQQQLTDQSIQTLGNA